MEKEIQSLAIPISNAARKAFIELFESKESFYYCALILTGEALPPYVGAWSREVLVREIANLDDPNEAQEIKWSYRDTPYLGFGESYFDEVRKIISKRPSAHANPDEFWKREYKIRLAAVEMAMSILDGEGLFALNQAREDVCVLVEIMPPNCDTEIGLRLNDPNTEIMKEWFEEMTK